MLDASTIIALLSLAASAFTIWFTMFRRGAVRMTQPGFILFGIDSDGVKPKIAIGVHLYTTAQRGAVVEGLFARAKRGTTVQDFDIWVHGSEGSKLTRGTAVHIGQQGLTCVHHFLLQEEVSPFEWLAGDYELEIFGTIVGHRGPRRLFHSKLTLADPIGGECDCMFFDWRPALQSYDRRAFTRRDREHRDAERLPRPPLLGPRSPDLAC
jgi:hypothetical protein